jgi:thiamine kinase-like enzyme
MANDNLAQMDTSQRILPEIEADYPCDALIHSEPVQFIEKKDGSIVFIDFEGIGMGSRYQDIGFVYYITMKDDQPEIYTAFMNGYQSEPIQIELVRVKKLAGIISLAYAGFAEFEKRMELGLRLLGETNQK